MNKKKRILHLDLVSLLAAQSSPIQGATLFGALGALGTAWYNRGAGTALSSTEEGICQASIDIAYVAISAVPMVLVIRKMIKLEQDMKTGIQEHNQEEQNVESATPH